MPPMSSTAIPVGTLLGGFVIERSDRVELVYAAIGVMTFAIAFAFRFTPLGRSEQYVREASALSEVDKPSSSNGD